MLRTIKRMVRRYLKPGAQDQLTEALMELFPDATIALNSKGVILALNTAFAETTGRQYDHILHSSVMEHLEDMHSIERVCACLNHPLSAPPLVLNWSGVLRKSIATEAFVKPLSKNSSSDGLLLLMLKERNRLPNRLLMPGQKQQPFGDQNA